ncbi:MAG: VOC family protein, partial [Dermatophilaceae bacterium]
VGLTRARRLGRVQRARCSPWDVGVTRRRRCRMSAPTPGTLHHVEFWVPDLARATAEWGWLLGEFGYQLFQEWAGGRSWRLGDTYVVVEQSAAMLGVAHERTRPGLNHLAFHAGDRARVDALTAEAPEHGWTLLFADRHPHAGGPRTYGSYLANSDGYEVELVASDP